MPFSTYNNYFRYNLVYYKSSFVKVINIRVYNTVFCNYIYYKAKLRIYRVYIFILGPFIVILMKQARLEL